MPVVCDKLFECPGWKKSYRQLNDAIIFCSKFPEGPKYMGVLFKFCPWCGKEIKWEEWERSIVEGSPRMEEGDIPGIATQLAANCGNPLDDSGIINTLVDPSPQEVYQKRWERIIRILETHHYSIHELDRGKVGW